jgi:hypothetical protein
MADVRLQSTDKKYAATQVVILIPVKRGLFRRNGLLVLDQTGALSLPSGMQEEGASWQETGAQIAARSGLDRAPGAMRLTGVLSDPNAGNLLVCETDPVSAAEGQRLAARGAQVIGKPAVMASGPATEIVKAFFGRPRYSSGNNSMVLSIIAATSTLNSSASCSSAAATNSFSSTNSCN